MKSESRPAVHSFSAKTNSGFRNLPIELYKTENSHYVFDARNVVFLEVDELVFAILSKLRETELEVDELVKALPQYASDEIHDACREIKEFQKDGCFTRSGFCRCSQYTRSDFEDALSNRLSGLTVYVTTECNLACSYCIYGGQYDRHRVLSGISMTWETAKNVIDFLVAHSEKSKSLRLDFFGGEPLLAFALIRRSVSYLKTILGPDRPPVTITIASNGTILTEEIVSFLLEHKVLFQFSIDGDKEIHDRHRRFKSGNHGSHDLVMKNLQRIYDYDPEYFRQCVRVKGVMTMQTLDSADEFFSGNPLIRILANQGHLTILLKEPHYDIEQDADYFEQIHSLGQRLLEANGYTKLSELLESLTFRQRTLFAHVFGEFTEVQSVNKVFFGNSDKVTFRKGCLMGFQEAAVYPDGDISICHKATSFVIGNINEGSWNFDKIWELHSRLHEWPECESCFVQRFCTLCYEKLCDGSRDWTETRTRFCDFSRKQYHIVFNYMLKLLDKNPQLWTDLDELAAGKIEEKLKALEEEAAE